MLSKKYTTVDEYFADLPENIKPVLEDMRKAVKQAAPKAEEVISYNMPAIKQGSVLVYYAANKEHTGFYPTPGPLKAFTEELAAYNSSKGAVQFPYDKKLPIALIKKMVKYRIAETEAKAVAKKKK